MENKNLKDKEKFNIIKKFLAKITIISGLIILISSLEAFVLAKSSELVNIYLQSNINSTPSDYLNIVMVNYFTNILEPILITLFSIFMLKKIGITKLYKIVFVIILFLRLFNIFISFKTQSIFYYLLIFLYILFIYIIIRTPETKRTKNYGIF